MCKIFILRLQDIICKCKQCQFFIAYYRRYLWTTLYWLLSLLVMSFGFYMNRISLLLLLLLLGSISLNYYLFDQNSQLSKHLDNPIIISKDAATSSLSPAMAATDTTKTDNQPNQYQPDSNQLATKANHAFDLRQFELAVQLYEEITLIDESQAHSVKLRWLEQLRQWLIEQQWPVVNQFIEQFLIRFSYDVDVLIIKADNLAGQNKPDQAIEQYLELHSLSFDTTQEEFFTARIRHIANEYIAILVEQKAWQQLVHFSEQVLVQDNQFPPYLLAQGKGLIELQDLNYAQDIIEPITDISFYRQQAEDLLDQIDRMRLHQTAIVLQPVGEHYLVNGRINRSNPVQLMIDTGASISVLTKDMFDQIFDWANPVFERDSLINTAGGTINAPIYRFERFQINEFVVNDISFVVIDMENFGNYHGLLGMNFLKQFKFEIDQQENLLVLSPK